MRVPAPAFAMTAAVAWGAMFPIAAHALSHVDSFNITALRYLGASLIFVLILLAVEGRASFATEGRGLRLFALGSLGFAGFNLLAYLGLAFTEPQNAAVIVPLMPLVTVMIRWRSDGVRPSPATLAAIAVALIGVLLVVTKGDPAQLRGSGGDLLVFLGVLGWVRYTLGAADFPTWSPLRYTTITAALGTITVVAATAAADVVGWQHVPTVVGVTSVWREISYLIVFGAVIAVLAWNRSVHLIGAANTSLFITLVPVTTFAIEVARGYRPGAIELIGAALVLLSLVVANLAARGDTAQAPEPSVAAGRDGQVA